MRDRELHEWVSVGDERAFTELTRRHMRSVRAVAFTILGPCGALEDVALDVFVNYWQHPSRFDPERGSLVGYLRLRARTIGIDLLRSERSRRQREENDASRARAPEPVEDAGVRLVVSSRVRAAIASLPARERRPVTLAFLGGLSYREVAIHLGLPEGTTKSQIRAGLQHMRATLTDLGDSELSMDVC
ncbi:MAG: RNA polymerase sigma factor [Acidimicrobiales bacterium]